MPQLPKKIAKRVEDTESEGGFEALPAGRYIGTLMDVEVKEGPKGPYWAWRFSDIVSKRDGKKYPGSQWVNTSLSETSDWKMKETFAAFGVPATTDTDELCGEKVEMALSVRVIEKGPREGEKANNVDRLFPLSAEGEEIDDDDDDDDTF